MLSLVVHHLDEHVVTMCDVLVLSPAPNIFQRLTAVSVLTTKTSDP